MAVELVTFLGFAVASTPKKVQLLPVASYPASNPIATFDIPAVSSVSARTPIAVLYLLVESFKAPRPSPNEVTPSESSPVTLTSERLSREIAVPFNCISPETSNVPSIVVLPPITKL